MPWDAAREPQKYYKLGGTRVPAPNLQPHGWVDRSALRC